MIEQMDLFSIIPTEEWVFETVKSGLTETLIQNNAGTDNLKIGIGKEYASAYYLKYDTYDPGKKPKELMVFRICCRDSQYYWGISDVYADRIPSQYLGMGVKSSKSDGYSNYNFVPTEDGIEKFLPLLAAILDAFFDSLPKEFDCCSRYEECSNCKRCIHPRPAMALSCGYRKILKKGRIYYGKNRNI